MLCLPTRCFNAVVLWMLSSGTCDGWNASIASNKPMEETWNRFDAMFFMIELVDWLSIDDSYLCD